MKQALWYVGVAILAVGTFAGVYFLGRRSAERVTYLSELSEKLNGKKEYFINLPLRCRPTADFPQGKDIGSLQVDLNLTNGKLVIARNDPKNYPNCSK